MVIAVDFDGTIVEHEYPNIGEPIPFAIDVLKKLQEEGHILLLWSVREGDLLRAAVDYCEQNGLRFYAANKNFPGEELNNDDTPRKLNADIFIDDRNIGGLVDWGVIYQIIRSGANDTISFNPFTEPINEKPHRKKNLFIRIGEAWDRAKGYNY